MQPPGGVSLSERERRLTAHPGACPSLPHRARDTDLLRVSCLRWGARPVSQTEILQTINLAINCVQVVALALIAAAYRTGGPGDNGTGADR